MSQAKRIAGIVIGGGAAVGEDRLAQLERLAKLRDAGVLSGEEFEAEKARVLKTPERPLSLSDLTNQRGIWLGLGIVLLVAILSVPIFTKRSVKIEDAEPAMVAEVPAQVTSAATPVSVGPVHPVEAVAPNDAGMRRVPPKITGDWRMVRTRIVNGWETEPTLAGRYVIIRIGCGTGCTSNIVGDHRTGELYDLGLGGEEYSELDLKFNNASDRLMARWRDGETCITQRYRWSGAELVEIGSREVAPSVEYSCESLGG